jgi:hypothetical protein
MTEHQEPPAPAARTNQPIQGYGGGQYLPQPQGQFASAPYAPPMGPGPIGKIGGTGVCVLLLIVTLGFYSLYWFFKTHEEMKRHNGQGLGGGLALLLAFFVGFVMPYLTSNEVGGLYDRTGRSRPVSALTGLWYFPGMFIVIGPIVWFVKTNGALNAYWRSMGAR